MSDQEKKPEACQIKGFSTCEMCYLEKPLDQAMSDYARLAVGATPTGLQIWCLRHNIGVCNYDFEGHSHPAIPAEGAMHPEDFMDHQVKVMCTSLQKYIIKYMNTDEPAEGAMLNVLKFTSDIIYNLDNNTRGASVLDVSRIKSLHYALVAYSKMMDDGGFDVNGDPVTERDFAVKATLLIVGATTGGMKTGPELKDMILHTTLSLLMPLIDYQAAMEDSDIVPFGEWREATKEKRANEH